ncbi:alpha-galactosidase [Diaminobutyricibacter sp. McL0608]|uniref:alpha-galactosidase n=1 Tax=Leifsonia sp. McL0608 TaxID=3143537 RepID=UPI0031F30AB6
MNDRLYWGNGTTAIEVEWSETTAPRIAAVHSSSLHLQMPAGLPLIDVLTVSHGHVLANDRLIHTSIGHESRYLRHDETHESGERTLTIVVCHELTRIESAITLTLRDESSVLRSSVAVTNAGTESVVLRAVPSFATYLGGDRVSDIRDWTVHHALSDWLGENRWVTEPLNGVRFPRLEQHLTNHNPRGEFSVVSTGTWSTGKHLPVAAVSSPRLHATWAWQIEHNGPWRWEIGEDTASGYVALSGPSDTDHQWTKVLEPGATFETVPVAIALGVELTEVIGSLTSYRRSSRRIHPDNSAMPVVFNDYMNTLDGDPTTEKLLPLIDAAGAAGADIFCIDAGWYDNSGDWWDSVGEWQASTVRFPNGFSEVIDRITSTGMIPGLWLEPEVVGIKSPIASTLPTEAFLQRSGKRVVEHDRYHLDLRHPAARDHLDQTIDRLVRDYGIGFFKLDYNINPGPGTDVAADSVGDGLLDHNRAHLAWLEGVLDRHPTLVLENCASGGMRADYAILSLLQLQSTSDQQDFLKYPPIAVSAPMSILPEQAASWAYPQPEMTLEEVAFCLTTGLLGRFYVSGYLNRMSPAQRDLVADSIAVAKSQAALIASARPFWPLGLPHWDAAWTSLGMASPEGDVFAVWNRDASVAHSMLSFPEWRGRSLRLRTVFPHSLPEWNSNWDSETGTLLLANPTGEIGARVFRIEVG